MATARQHHGNSLATAWQMLGNCMANARNSTSASRVSSSQPFQLHDLEHLSCGVPRNCAPPRTMHDDEYSKTLEHLLAEARTRGRGRGGGTADSPRHRYHWKQTNNMSTPAPTGSGAASSRKMGRNKMPQAANSIQEPLASTGDDDKGTGHDGKGKGTVDDANGGALYRYQ